MYPCKGHMDMQWAVFHRESREGTGSRRALVEGSQDSTGGMETGPQNARAQRCGKHPRDRGCKVKAGCPCETVPELARSSSCVQLTHYGNFSEMDMLWYAPAPREVQ